MTYNHPEIKKFLGLYIQANSFSVPDGALETADNVVIAQDGVITKRRGFSTFSTPASGTLNNLFLFQNNLLALYQTKIASVDSSGVQTNLTPYTGVTVSETGGRIGRSVSANSNFYFTSDNGVLKLETYSGTVYASGIPPALDLRAAFDPSNGPIGDGSTAGSTFGDTQVAWRVTFGKTDGNSNLLEGAPSDVALLANAPLIGQVASWNGTTVTVNTTIPHNYSTGMTVMVTSASSPGINGTPTITVTGLGTFTYPNATSASSAMDLTLATSRSTKLEFSIPSEIHDISYFYRIYRSSQSVNGTTTPNPDYKLIKQQNLTSSQLTAGIVFFDDTILDIFQSSAPELYTNPNSQQGELQAATRAPLCQDVCFYKNHTFYANTTSRHLLALAMVSTSTAFVVNGDNIEIKLGSTTRRYVFRSGVGNSTAHGTAAGTTTITVTYASHGLSNGDTIYVSNVTGTVPEGFYVVSGVAANTFQITSTSNTASALDFQGVFDGSSHYLVQLVPPGSAPSVGLDSTTRALVKAVNRDTSSLVYARYTSGPEDIPGNFLLQAKGFGGAFSLDASSTAVGQAFSPTLPNSFSSGTQVTSANDVQPNTIFSSKLGEPESVPLVNTLPIGSKDKAILRVVPLRDCCIVVKEDGVFRIDGDQVTNFVSTILDSTVICLVASSVGLLDNTVMMLSNQGVVKISSSAVQIVSYKVEQIFRPILGSTNLVANTSAVTYESDRLYLLTTLEPNTSSAATVYCYNTLSDCWTTWDTLFLNGIVGPGDKLFTITLANVIAKERKNQNKIDYCDQDYAVTIVSVSTDKLSAVITTSIIPQANDIIVSDSVISRIKSVAVSGGSYVVTFYQMTNMAASASAVYYSQYISTIKFAPFHAGAVNRAKQFSQFQLHMRDYGASLFTVTFSNETFGSSEPVEWNSYLIAGSTGWGFEPWGFFGWGDTQGINLTYTTQPGPVLRTYVPKFAQRGCFIQAEIVHASAGERLGIQEVGYTVRGYGERVSK